MSLKWHILPHFHTDRTSRNSEYFNYELTDKNCNLCNKQLWIAVFLACEKQSLTNCTSLLKRMNEIFFYNSFVTFTLLNYSFSHICIYYIFLHLFEFLRTSNKSRIYSFLLLNWSNYLNDNDCKWSNTKLQFGCNNFLCRNYTFYQCFDKTFCLFLSISCTSYCKCICVNSEMKMEITIKNTKWKITNNLVICRFQYEWQFYFKLHV